jgi:hypothetical protein
VCVRVFVRAFACERVYVFIFCVRVYRVVCTCVVSSVGVP